MNAARIGRTRVSRVLIAACIIAPAIAGAWALRPLAVVDAVAPDPAPEAVPDRDRQGPSFNLAAFSAPVWVAAPVPEPPAEPTPASPPPPLRLQLLAIVHEEGVLRAMLYDEAADRVRVVGDGDTLGEGRSVESIEGRRVRINDAGQVRTLALQGGNS